MAKKKNGELDGRSTKIGGTRKGIPNKSSVEARSRLEEMGCDPLAFTAGIMMGTEMLGDHPFLPKLLNKLDRFAIAFRDKGMIVEAKIAENIIREAKVAMSGSETDKTLQANSAYKLLDYAYPKLRAMEVKIDKVKENVEDYSDDDLIQLLRDDPDGPNKNKQDTTKH